MVCVLLDSSSNLKKDASEGGVLKINEVHYKQLHYARPVYVASVTDQSRYCIWNMNEGARVSDLRDGRCVVLRSSLNRTRIRK
jgi:hypothetical protein